MVKVILILLFILSYSTAQKVDGLVTCPVKCVCGTQLQIWYNNGTTMQTRQLYGIIK